jgi:amino acid transporter
VRALGALSLTAVSVNSVIGAGIFALPGAVAQLLGPASGLAYLLAGAAALLIALCFAEAGSRLESSGGPYLYARTAFGEFAGFQVAWLYLLARLTAVAAISNTFSDYLGYFWPLLAQGPGRVAAITAMIAALAGIHVLGVRPGAAVNNLLTIGKLLPLFAFCLAGLFLLDANVLPEAPLPGARPLQQAGLLLFFALGGFENASVPSEEVIRPRRNLPIALIASVVLVTALYLWIQVVAMAARPGLASSATPLASAAESFLGPAGGLMLTAGAAISTAGSSHVNLFIGPRILYALGRDGALPAALARLHPRYRTPVAAILIYAAAAWLAAVNSRFAQLAALSALARLALYLSTCLAAPVLRRRFPPVAGALTLPGGVAVPALALAVCAWLLTGSTRDQAVIGIATLAAGALLFAILRRARRPLPEV